MSYRYRRIDVRKGRLLWFARPVSVDVPEGDELFTGMDLVPHCFGGEVWWRGFTRRQAVRRARRYADRENRRDVREGHTQSIGLHKTRLPR